MFWIILWILGGIAILPILTFSQFGWEVLLDFREQGKKEKKKKVSFIVTPTY